MVCCVSSWLAWLACSSGSLVLAVAGFTHTLTPISAETAHTEFGDRFNAVTGSAVFHAFCQGLMFASVFVVSLVVDQFAWAAVPVPPSGGASVSVEVG